jgi:chromate reductase, NAD(P)H dehydrogenase (quinone)
MEILAISGSLRPKSSNTAILQIMQTLASNLLNISIYDGIGKLPHFNPDLDGDSNDVLASVMDWRTRLKNAEGVIFCTPEYAYGVPGVLKNALDWIVSSGEFMHKPTAVVSASPSPDGGDKANASLVETLRVMMADIREETILCIPTVSAKVNREGLLTDPATETALRSLLDVLACSIQENTTDGH